jgi:hypothetical protein
MRVCVEPVEHIAKHIMNIKISVEDPNMSFFDSCMPRHVRTSGHAPHAPSLAFVLYSTQLFVEERFVLRDCLAVVGAGGNLRAQSQ